MKSAPLQPRSALLFAYYYLPPTAYSLPPLHNRAEPLDAEHAAQYLGDFAEGGVGGGGFDQGGHQVLGALRGGAHAGQGGGVAVRVAGAAQFGQLPALAGLALRVNGEDRDVNLFLDHMLVHADDRL